MENKFLKNVLLSIMGALIVAEMVIRIIVIQTNTLPGIAQLISLAFTALYGFWLYKKPHGKLLKYSMLIYAFSNIMISSYYLTKGGNVELVKILAMAAVCYCAGRLKKIDQNKYLMPLIGLVLLVVSIIGAQMEIQYARGFLYIACCFTFTINYITLMIAYFVRYKEYREAGLGDSQEN